MRVERLLPYVDRLGERPLRDIDLLVMHCTELPDLALAREYGERIHHPASQTGNSGHYYIDRDGLTECWVPPQRIAHHVRGWNERSVGIELVNRGRFPDWYDSRHQAMDEPYPEAQLLALLALLAELGSALPGLRWIAGHEDLDLEQVAASDDASLKVARKRDPGPQFPWSRVLAQCGLDRIERIGEAGGRN